MWPVSRRAGPPAPKADFFRFFPVSTHRTNSGPYRLVFTPAAQERWQRLPSRERKRLDRAMAKIAFTVGLRQWVNPLEAREEFQVQVGEGLVTYELDASLRALVVKRLELAG
jgi:hypothetical protein